MSLERQVQALVRIAREYRAEHCGALLRSAEGQARQILSQANAMARSRAREALTELRERLDTAIAAAETELVMQRRVNAEKKLVAALEASLPVLDDGLERYWTSPEGRARWIEHHLGVAASVLPEAEWTVFHPPGLSLQDGDDIRRQLRERGIENPRLECDPALAGGIRVACGPNLLDASFEGVLADRDLIKGRLLHHLADVA